MPKTPKKILDMGGVAGPALTFDVGGVEQKAHRTWYRGDACNYNPSLENMIGVDAVQDHVLAGWAPSGPLISGQTNTMAFGSCFARHIGDWLSRRDYAVVNRKDGKWGETYIARFGEGMVNSHAILQQFEWALEGKAFAEELWHDQSALPQNFDEDIRADTKEAMLASDVFIITLGLSEVWSDKATGDVFWRAVPQDLFDPERHEFRVSSHAENLENLRRIHRLIRSHKPEAKVIFTLSPVPLVATFRPVSCITANTASKAILRAALDEFLRETQPGDPNLFYWPSYEIIMDVFAKRWSDDRRHIKTRILDYVMVLFEHIWCTGAPQISLKLAWLKARCAAGDLPGRLHDLLEAGNFKAVDRLMANQKPADQELVRQVRLEMAAQASTGGTR